MGEFVLEVGDRQTILPNQFHLEGAELLWRKGFLGDEDIDQWVIGITSLDIPNQANLRPDHTASPIPELGLDEESTYADIVAYGTPGGAANSTHLEAMAEYEESPAGTKERVVTFSTGYSGTGGYAQSTYATFKNQLPWYPVKLGRCGGWMHSQVDWLGAAYGAGSEEHGYPWSTPIYWPGMLFHAFRGVCDRGADVDGYVRLNVTLPDEDFSGYRCYLTNRATCRKYGPFEVQSNTTSRILLPSAADSLVPTLQMMHVLLREPNSILESVEANPWLGVTMPVSAAYLAAKVDDDMVLVASCKFSTEVTISPSDAILPLLRVRYRAYGRGFLPGADS